MESIRNNYIKRLDPYNVKRFEKSLEFLTFNAANFFYAIQTGDTVKEAHTALVIRNRDGTGTLVDRTKGVVFELNKDQLRSYWHNSVPFVAQEKKDIYQQDISLTKAISLFKEGKVEDSRVMLEELHKQNPNDNFVLYNLGVAYMALKDVDKARNVLQSLPKNGPWWGQ
jgi:tetratricopeptide (TPR) repeat protein